MACDAEPLELSGLGLCPAWVQFLVHRDRIRRWPVAFYQNALEVMYREGAESREASRKLGLLMEWLWHYIFGEGAVAQEDELLPLAPILPHVERLAIARRPPCLRSPLE